MRLTVTSHAEGDQIQIRVIPGVTAKFLVMNFKVRHRTTGLTSPAIASQDSLP